MRRILIVASAAAAISMSLTVGSSAHHNPNHQPPGQAEGGPGGGPPVNDGERGPAEKVDVCHVTGDGTFHLLNINGNALEAHLGHGDALPGATVGDVVLGIDCSVETPPVEPTTVSVTLAFGPLGWGGVSCPAGTEAVGGGYETATGVVLVSELAGPGAVYPHYTFGPTESGWVVQNGDMAQTLTVFANCAPVAPAP